MLLLITVDRLICMRFNPLKWISTHCYISWIQHRLESSASLVLGFCRSGNGLSGVLLWAGNRGIHNECLESGQWWKRIEEREDRSADKGLFIAVQRGILAPWDVETQILYEKEFTASRRAKGCVVLL